jgi:hypothetical protein
MNVEYISDKNDDVWYQSRFNPVMSWPGQKNPFIAHRKDAVESFCCKHVADEFKWTVSQHGTVLKHPRIVVTWFIRCCIQSQYQCSVSSYYTGKHESLRIAPAFEFVKFDEGYFLTIP